MYDPRDMLLFAKVAELGSMSAAARALFKPKASVSRAIARLESALDTPLLERSSRRIVLTQVGRVFLAHCQRIADEIGEAEAAVGELQGAVRGLLRVAARPRGRRFQAGRQDVHFVGVAAPRKQLNVAAVVAAAVVVIAVVVAAARAVGGGGDRLRQPLLL